MSTKEKATETDEAPAKGSKKKLMLIVLVVLLAAGGAAYFFLFSGKAEAKAPESSGTFLALEPVAVNLAGGGYLKVGVSLELTTEGAASGGEGGALDGSKATDLVISTFSQAAPADVTGARDALKAALEQKIVQAYTVDGVEMVMGLYYTEYVTQ
jgi:flagellar FliL protein